MSLSKGTAIVASAPSVTVRLTHELLVNLDDWRSRQRPIPNRSEAVRHFVEAGLAASEAKTAEA